jgi:hypothetical protein
MVPRTRADALAIALSAILAGAVISSKLIGDRSGPPAENRIEPAVTLVADAPPLGPATIVEPVSTSVAADSEPTPIAPESGSTSVAAEAESTRVGGQAGSTLVAAETPPTTVVAEAEPTIVAAVPEQPGIFARYRESLIRPAHDRVVMQYTPSILRRVLDRAAEYFKAPVLVTSAYRSPHYNRRVGGVRRSMHMVRDGKRGAVDFKVVGVSKRVLYAWAKAQPEVHGIGLYCRSDFIHVDNGEKRSWYWGCGGRRHGRGSKRIRVAGASHAPPSSAD